MMKYKPMTVAELQLALHRTRTKRDALKKSLNVSKRANDWRISATWLKSKGFKVPHAWFFKRNHSLKKHFNVFLEKAYYQGRLEQYRQDHPEQIIKESDKEEP